MPSTILAEKVETILRRSELNTRPRGFYDVYILVKTQRQAFDRNILTTALKATSENMMSLAALEDREKILQTIQSDPIMRQRWGQYRKAYYYAKDIEFDDVIGVLLDISG